MSSSATPRFSCRRRYGRSPKTSVAQSGPPTAFHPHSRLREMKSARNLLIRPGSNSVRTELLAKTARVSLKTDSCRDALLVPERHHRIDLRARRAGKKHAARPATTITPMADQRDRIARRDARQLAREHSRRRHACHQPDAEPDGNQPQAHPGDHAEHVRSARAERHPDADLVRLTRHGVGDDAVDADRHEEQTEAREDAQQDQAKARFRVGETASGTPQRSGHRDRDAPVDRPDLASHAVQQRSPARFGPDRMPRSKAPVIVYGMKASGIERIADALILRVRDHADDLEDRVLDRRPSRQGFEETELDPLANRILRTPKNRSTNV